MDYNHPAGDISVESNASHFPDLMKLYQKL